MSPNVRGALLALIAFGIFSTSDVIVKTLGAYYAPVQLVFFSTLLGFPLATMMLMRDPTPGTLKPANPWWIAARVVATVFTGLCGFYAFSALPLAQTYAIIFASPLLITVLSIPILGEKVRMRRWAAVIVGLIGVAVVLRPGSAELGLGHLAALGAATGNAVASIIARKIGTQERTVVMAIYPLMGNFLFMGAGLAFFYEPMAGAHFGLVALMSTMGFIASVLVVMAYSTGEATVVAPMQYSQIIWATFYGYIFFSETIDFYTALGAAIIIASGLYIVFRESRASENTPVLRSRSRPSLALFRVGAWVRLERSRQQAK
ncbi:DMT family transporter [Pelagovum pacificum]|uniref:DMT family transporter n=1 Tax=Pelagovum pacificum TaxID=2588711 RepID=A0A5C5GHA4_9RHOB|nr:DMT family transporter [Pelagovum pacificum]QQA42691.1 DMT family transporter [Pelagovum pacificum]TNY34158.1 DMT family transporter [Pelagovum pacificum]